MKVKFLDKLAASLLAISFWRKPVGLTVFFNLKNSGADPSP
jgi:hypothetical protein